METIFDHNPTSKELDELGLSRISREFYSNFHEGTAWFHLALLFRQRYDKENEERAWSHIPDRRDEFLRGFDVEFIDD